MGREERCHLILLYVLLLNYKVLCVYFCWYTCHVLRAYWWYWCTGTGVVLVCVLVLAWYRMLPAACCLLPVMGD